MAGESESTPHFWAKPMVARGLAHRGHANVGHILSKGDNFTDVVTGCQALCSSVLAAVKPSHGVVHWPFYSLPAQPGYNGANEVSRKSHDPGLQR
jgi:hypothetical protein